MSLRPFLLGILMAAVSTGAFAQSTVHRPIGTGSCSPHVGGDYNDASALVWVPLAQKWIMTDQRYFYVFSKDGALERQSSSVVTCKGATEHEGFTLVDSPRCSNDAARRCYTSSDCAAPGTCSVGGPNGDVLWVQDEDLGRRCTNNPGVVCGDDAACGGTAGQSTLCQGSGAMCRYSVSAILGMGTGSNPATPVSLEEVWVTGVPSNSNEGLVFVPGLPGSGRYGGKFFWSEQANARWKAFTLDAVQPAITWGAYQSFPAGCEIGGDLADGYYDFVKARFYSQSDGGNRYTVHSGDFTTCYASIPDVPTCRSDDGYEAMAFGGGKLAYADDVTGHPDDANNGLWLFADDYCGDEVRVATEVCDGPDLAGKTCATATTAECANGRCGAGYSGTLKCRTDCARFDDSGCSQSGVPGPVLNLRRTDRL